MNEDDAATAWRRMRAEQERRLAASATSLAGREVHLRLAALHERASETGDQALLIVGDR